MITGQTQLLGVIGDPIAHSLSPLMHNAALAAMGLDYVYVPLHVTSSNLEPAIAGLAAIEVIGFNLTIPHKQTILPLLSSVSATAQAVGAVNTVWRTPAGWSGTNTDVEGFLSPLRLGDQDWSQRTAMILGNGGAARAVVAGCAQLGCAAVRVLGRDAKKLNQFQQSWAASALTIPLYTHLWSELPDWLNHADLLVNTTPIGMHPYDAESPLPEGWLSQLPSTAIVYDLIYTPSPTRFLQQAQQHGLRTIDGLEMLIQQGAAALKIWVQQPAPVEIMRQSLHEYLGRAAISCNSEG